MTMIDKKELAGLLQRRLAEVTQGQDHAAGVFMDEPMAVHLSFRTGGPADVFVLVQTRPQLMAALQTVRAQGVPYFLLGRGTNLLVSDDGYHGCVIMLGTLSELGRIEVQDNEIVAGAGAALAGVAATAARRGLSGFEFAAGIPGSIGGALVMNAGAYGGEMKDVVTEATLLDDGQIIRLTSEEMEFGYRTSILKRLPYTALEARIRLTPADPEQVSSRIQELARLRSEKQPLEYPSAGSTFKRPQGNFAGKLIMDAGLAGFRIGGAAVSEKHCGFVVNLGGATSRDIWEVIRQVRQRVLEESGISLEPEVIMLGDFQTPAERKI